MYKKIEMILMNHIIENRLEYRCIILKSPLYGIKNNYYRVTEKKELILNTTKYNNGNIGIRMTPIEIINKLPKDFNKNELLSFFKND
jgi:hypothetical protein